MKIEATIEMEARDYFYAKNILNQIGLTYSQAINIFNNVIVSNNGLPLEFKMTNLDTKRALEELETRNGKSFETVDELFNDLDN